MRDMNRIPKILKELEKFWYNHPDWRLGQIVSNLNYEVMGGDDPFYLEDDLLLELLEKRNNKEKKRDDIG